MTSDKLPDFEELKYVCKLMFDYFQIPVYLINQHGEIEIDFSADYSTAPLYTSKTELIQQLLRQNDPFDFPVIRTTKYLESFIMIRSQTVFVGTVIMGPTRFLEMSEESLPGLMNDHHIPIQYKDDMLHYYRRIPVINKLKLIQISLLHYYLIYHQQLEESEIIQKNMMLENEPSGIEIKVDLELSRQREYHSFHHDPLDDIQFQQCIKEGNKEGLIRHLNTFIPKPGVLSKKSHLRNQKNLAICKITVATRAAMEGGLHPEVAFTTSNLYIQQLEELSEINKVSNLLFECLCNFADSVSQCKEQKYSKAITVCQNYIFKHIYEEITLLQLAEIVDLHPAYLSQLFKKEVGMLLSEYIQRERLEEVKKLLILSDYSLGEICTRLNFYDQSYFTRIFKKYTGVTPKRYRDLHVI